MKKNDIGVYITSDYLYLCTKQKIYKEKLFNDAVINNRINKSDDFLKQLNQILKKNNLNNSIISKHLNIINLPLYLQSDVELIMAVFEKANFNKIKLINYNEIIESNHLILNINECDMIISKKEINYYIDFKMFINKDLINNIVNIIDDYITDKEIYIIGNNKNLVALQKKIEKKYNIKAYMYDNKDLYIIKKLQLKDS